MADMANSSKSVPERTFQYQDQLPPLPVPCLHQSLQKYLDAVKPFATEEEFEATVKTVRRFEEGIGKELHLKLQQRASQKRNWLEEWWLDAAYLEVRAPSQLYVNFGGPAPYLEHCWPPADGVELHRASIITWHSLVYWDMIRNERLPPQKAGKTPLDMDQFKMLFNTCKVPGITKDSIHNYFKTESEGACPSHVVVLCRGRIFMFDAVCDGEILTPPELFRQLSYVKQCCVNRAEGDGVAALTSEERTQWAKAREHLINIDPHNKDILEVIQSSLFVICLDETKPYSTPHNYTNMTSEAMVGNPTIRWGDKSYNSIVYSDGTFGSNCDVHGVTFLVDGPVPACFHGDVIALFPQYGIKLIHLTRNKQHAPYDAMVLVSFCWYLDQQLSATGGEWKGPNTVRPLPLPEELVFTVDSEALSYISQAKQQYLETTKDLQIVCYAFTAFGKAAIKQRKLHPDTFVQLAMQLAYYRLYNEPGSCYETAMTRKFYHGRTETMRPCTSEALEWCKAMVNPKCDMNTRRKAMLSAFNKHNKLMAEAQDGKGFDRHLLGLYLIAKEEGLSIPDLYRDPLYSKSGGGGNFVLSSSLVGYTTVLGAVAPMVRQGYGVFYRIRDDRLVFSVSAWKSCHQTDAATYFNNLSSSLHEMLHLATTAQL